MPPNTVSVARPSKFGNPFRIEDAREAGFQGTTAELHDMAVSTFRNWLFGDDSAWMGPEADAARLAILENLDKLRGKNLACYCKPWERCHADVLLYLANKPSDTDSFGLSDSTKGKAAH